jgi:hypothetical protein
LQAAQTIVMQFVKDFDNLHKCGITHNTAKAWIDAAIEPTLIYGGSDEYSHNGVKVVGWEKCGAVL